MKSLIFKYNELYTYLVKITVDKGEIISITIEKYDKERLIGKLKYSNIEEIIANMNQVSKIFSLLYDKENNKFLNLVSSLNIHSYGYVIAYRLLNDKLHKENIKLQKINNLIKK